MSRPTEEAYTELQSAYDFFNTELFNGELPPCLITLQREGRNIAGYFSSERFVSVDKKRKTDEIAMNPMLFGIQSVTEVLQTLLHEMVHLWQHHKGKSSRKCYHNKEWAEKMESLGLMPSSTGHPGGQKTGQKMSDYPIVGGRFLAACDTLLQQNFVLSWSDRSLMPITPADSEGTEDGEESEGTEAAAEPKSGKRIKYTCPCGKNVWGKADLNVICGECEGQFNAK